MNTSQCSSIFEVLGFEIRLKIFKFIIQAGNEGVAPKHIIKEFDVDSGTLSFHLKKLEKVKLIAKKLLGKGQVIVCPLQCQKLFCRYS